MSSASKEVWVIGHKNPDTDSICSAICYARFKNKLTGTEDFRPMRAGNISDETGYVLDFFGESEPQLAVDARPQLYNTEFHSSYGVTPNSSIRDAYETAEKTDLVTVPVLEDGRLCGVVTVGDICRYVFKALGKACETSDFSKRDIESLLDEPIAGFMKNRDELVVFKENDYIEDVLSVIADLRYRYFPVESEDGYFSGLVSKGGLLRFKKKKIVLVDHDEKSQAVDGIDTTEIVEIIDHHRLGGMVTLSPLFMRVEPVGCTATIIYKMYMENKIDIDKKTAGLLVSAIISDTLLFRSPTCTEDDRQAGEALAAIAEIELDSYAKEMFKAGSNLESKTAAEILSIDCKKFESNAETIAVAQVSTVNADEIPDIEKKVADYIEEFVKDKKLSKAYLMITDILTESSTLVCGGAGALEFARKVFKADEAGEYSVFLPGVVSRKKQIVPAIMEAIK